MAKGFTVTQRIARPDSEVWAYLTDFDNAENWMGSVESMDQLTPGPLRVGTRFKFRSRGKDRETHVSDYAPGERIALNSTQGGVTATYTYSLAPSGDATEVRLEAVCSATGLWRLLHPLIVALMKKSDSGQLSRLAAAMESRAES